MKTVPTFVALALLLSGCAATPPDRSPSPTDAAPTAATASPGTPAIRDVATGLAVPWSMARLPDGSALVTHRDSAAISQVAADGAVTPLGRVDGVVPGGEGGLLGIAVEPGGNPRRAFVYYTAEGDNRVARLGFTDDSIDDQRPILTGIPKGAVHNGGRIAFGPGGLLYVATGETGIPELAQERTSLGGKILRITTEGAPAPGNPDPGSPVYSLGHRNVQGLAWDEQGRLWASEFGQNDVDELNRVEPGGNYGWPQCEGACGEPGTIDPAAEWSPTSVASPSGMVIAAGSAWIASLRGETLWQVPLEGAEAGEPRAWYEGRFGRLRDVIAATPRTLWVATNNTDGRGDPRPGDDRILAVTLPGR